jgi:hypothetical protein
MLGNLALARAGPHASVFARVARALDRRRLAAAGLVTVMLSLGALLSPALLDFFSPAEIALAWLEHLAELAVIAIVLLAAFTVLDEALPRSMPLRCSRSVDLPAPLGPTRAAFSPGSKVRSTPRRAGKPPG